VSTGVILPLHVIIPVPDDHPYPVFEFRRYFKARCRLSSNVAVLPQFEEDRDLLVLFLYDPLELPYSHAEHLDFIRVSCRGLIMPCAAGDAGSEIVVYELFKAGISLVLHHPAKSIPEFIPETNGSGCTCHCGTHIIGGVFI